MNPFYFLFSFLFFLVISNHHISIAFASEELNLDDLYNIVPPPEEGTQSLDETIKEVEETLDREIESTAERFPNIDAQETSTLDSQPQKSQDDRTIPQQGSLMSKVKLVILDKVTARMSEVIVSLNEEIRFGNLLITPRKVWKAPPEDPPDVVTYIELYEAKPGENTNHIFSGWMFASNPSISAMQHPVYDLWIKDAVGEEVTQASDPIYDSNTKAPLHEQNAAHPPVQQEGHSPLFSQDQQSIHHKDDNIDALFEGLNGLISLE